MPEHKDIYNQYGRMYDRLVSREDYEQNILSTLQGISSLAGKDVVELGAGTGRLTCLLAPCVHSIQAFDASQHMLDFAIGKLKDSKLDNWHLQISDHRSLPVEGSCADIAISGWSICYLVDWNRDGWQADVDQALAEMRRVLRPGGVIILLETMGTGFQTPHPPDHLVDYYRALEDMGFAYQWIRTDYQFVTVDEAVKLVQFFFGDELADQLRANGSKVLPQCTGIWWKRFDA